MESWTIIIIVIIGVIWGIGLLLCLLMFILGWTEHRKLEWTYLIGGLLFPCVILYGLYNFLCLYYSIIKNNGGIIGHIHYVKQCKRQEKENRRIEEAYKRGEIKREELPRQWCDGITHFELKGELLCGDDWRELVYIENEYNEILNNFFERHDNIELKDGYKVIYLSDEIRKLARNDIVTYWAPLTEKPTIESIKISSIDLLNDLYYPEDAKNLHHGLMSIFGTGTNHGAEYVHGTYFPLEEGTDEEILFQIKSIVKKIIERYSGGLCCSVDRPSLDEERTEDFADEQFSWEINKLIEEVKERIDKLEQHGISRRLLMKMIPERPKLSRLIVSKDMRIILPDYNNMEIKMEPINKAVFLLFLRHPEGIIFKELPDYRKELVDIYQKIKPLGLNDRAIQSIEDVTNPLLNSINEKCARIRGAFIYKFDDSLAQHYYIYGMRGEPKKISLPRDLVVWE